MKGSMPQDFVFSKLSRQETKERYALKRQLEKCVKQAAQGTGWKFARSTLFREYQGWFVETVPIVAMNKFETHLQFHTKPMAIDPVFWQVVELPENIQLPLSFRATGAWTCHTYPIAKAIQPDAAHDAETLAGLVLDWADEQLGRFGQQWTLDDFISDLQQANNGWNFASLVSALIVAGRNDEAMTTCLKAKPPTGDGFSAGGRSFTDLAVTYLRNSSISDAAEENTNSYTYPYSKEGM